MNGLVGERESWQSDCGEGQGGTQTRKAGKRIEGGLRVETKSLARVQSISHYNCSAFYVAAVASMAISSRVGKYGQAANTGDKAQRA